MKVWATPEGIINEIAEVPDNWLRRFALNHPGDFRKLGDARNCKTLYRVDAVLAAIEEGVTFREAVSDSLTKGGCDDTHKTPNPGSAPA